MDFPTAGISPAVLSVYSRYCATSTINLLVNSASFGGSNAYPSANRGLFVPIWLPGPFKLAAGWCVNGATATGNLDIGLYSPDGSLVQSKGSTAQSGTSTLQILTYTTPIVVPPGRYYMALSASSTSATFYSRTPTTSIQTRMGVLQAASQLPLATLPTFATPASAYLPHFGISQITVF